MYNLQGNNWSRVLVGAIVSPSLYLSTLELDSAGWMQGRADRSKMPVYKLTAQTLAARYARTSDTHRRISYIGGAELESTAATRMKAHELRREIIRRNGGTQ